ncbi:diguanylate cyclase [Pseudoalteromonas sp. GB56]
MEINKRDPEGNIKTWSLVYANPLALASWDRKNLTEVKDKSTDEIFGDGATEHYLSIITELFEKNETKVFFDYFPHLDKHFRFTSFPYTDFFITTGEDVTDLIKQRDAIQEQYDDLTTTNQALEISNFRINLAADSARIGFWDLNLDTNELVWDAQMYQMYGITETTFGGAYDAWSSCLYPDDKEQAERAFNTAIEGSGRLHTEFRILHPDGSLRWVQADARLHADPFDGCRHIVGVNRDITSMVLAKEALNNERKRFEQLYNSSDVAIFDKDFSAVLTLFQALRDDDVTDFKTFFHDNPSVIDEMLEKVIVNQINAATLELFEAKNAQELRESTVANFGGNDADILVPMLFAIWEQLKIFKADTTIVTVKGNTKDVHISMPIPDTPQGFSHIPVSYFDITERIQSQQKLQYQASHDILTGLINRHEFETRAKMLLKNAKQTKQRHTFCFLDLDQFKLVNDTCGHPAGDELLRQLSQVIKMSVRKHDVVARLGGDEFGLLMEGYALKHSIRVIEEVLIAISEFQFVWENKIHRISASVGVVEITELVSNFDELLKESDVACYLAKENGRNRYHISEPEDSVLARRHKEMQWVCIIHDALENDKFELFAQPIVDFKTNKSTRYELLIRMFDEQNNLIGPDSFLPSAERYGLMEKIDTWVIKRGLQIINERAGFLKPN